MIYHFSAKFDDSEWSYHGQFESDVFDLSLAKIKLAEKMQVWIKRPEQLTSFEVYTFEDEKENQIFKWEK